GQASARLLVENDGTEAITSMDIQQYLIGNVTADTASFRWEGLLEPGGRQYIQMPPLQSVPGEYEYVANIVLANGQSDARWLNNQLKTRARIIADEFIEAQVSDNYQPCQGGQALLQSLYDGQGEVRWYDEPVDGSLLGEGRNALLPVADEPLTVYMEVAPVEMVGRPDNVEGTTQYSTDAYGLSFDAYSAFTIKSVKVYTEEAGSRLLILEGPNGYSFTKIVPMGVGEQRVELNLHIEPGEGWVLRLRAGKPLGLSLGGSDYPYVVPNVLSINRSTQSLIYYNYFYDWEVEY
ncbi:MAG: hypothetical protein KDD06_27035, partial [Phaeodactylibacter sp.]|nr:hypothetical protein [Phaeodactylibacter sp.]